MQAGTAHGPTQRTGRWQRVLGLACAMALASASLGRGRVLSQIPHRPSQGQAAFRFLRAVLRADYAAAYAQLAPEVRQTVSFGRFEATARPLWKSGQQHRPAIELYKLGVRLGDNGASRLFYAFAFATDSSRKTPSVLLEVTFRDTASRAVLGFGLRQNVQPKKKAAY